MTLKENILLNYLNNKVTETYISNIRNYYYIGNQTLIVASDIIALFNEKIKKPAELNTEYKSDYSKRILKLFDKVKEKCIIDKIKKRVILGELFYFFVTGEMKTVISDNEMNILLKIFDNENGIKENVFITNMGLMFNVDNVNVLMLNKFLRDIDRKKRIDECAMNF